MASSLPSLSQAVVTSISIAWRLVWMFRLSWRENFTFTGRPVAHAIRAAWCCTLMSSLPPKPPPTSFVWQRTFSGSIFSMRAISFCSSYTDWLAVYSSRPPLPSGMPMAHSGSMKAWSVIGVE